MAVAVEYYEGRLGAAQPGKGGALQPVQYARATPSTIVAPQARTMPVRASAGTAGSNTPSSPNGPAPGQGASTPYQAPPVNGSQPNNQQQQPTTGGQQQTPYANEQTNGQPTYPNGQGSSGSSSSQCPPCPACGSSGPSFWMAITGAALGAVLTAAVLKRPG